MALAISKQTIIRELSPAETIHNIKVCLSLLHYIINPKIIIFDLIIFRYLATGDSMHSMSYHFLAGVLTISHIIGETCDAIWNFIHQKVIKQSHHQKLQRNSYTLLKNLKIDEISIIV